MSDLFDIIAMSILIIGIWFVPICEIYWSKKVSRQEKFLWISACIFLSWFSWILFYFFAPLLDKKDQSR
jgi:hypothetical protein